MTMKTFKKTYSLFLSLFITVSALTSVLGASALKTLNPNDVGDMQNSNLYTDDFKQDDTHLPVIYNDNDDFKQDKDAALVLSHNDNAKQDDNPAQDNQEVPTGETIPKALFLTVRNTYHQKEDEPLETEQLTQYVHGTDEKTKKLDEENTKVYNKAKAEIENNYDQIKEVTGKVLNQGIEHMEEMNQHIGKYIQNKVEKSINKEKKTGGEEEDDDLAAFLDMVGKVNKKYLSVMENNVENIYNGLNQSTERKLAIYEKITKKKLDLIKQTNTVKEQNFNAKVTGVEKIFETKDKERKAQLKNRQDTFETIKKQGYAALMFEKEKIKLGKEKIKLETKEEELDAKKAELDAKKAKEIANSAKSKAEETHYLNLEREHDKAWERYDRELNYIRERTDSHNTSSIVKSAPAWILDKDGKRIGVKQGTVYYSAKGSKNKKVAANDDDYNKKNAKQNESQKKLAYF